MIWLLWKLLTLPVRVVLGVVSLAYRILRAIGFDRMAAFGAGIGVGVVLRPTVDAQRQATTAQHDEQRAVRAGDLGATVRHELATSPRTWHLPQPGVTVDGDRVALTGTVPHEQARGDLVRTAGALAGVRAVDDHLTVEGDGDATEGDGPADLSSRPH